MIDSDKIRVFVSLNDFFKFERNIKQSLLICAISCLDFTIKFPLRY